MAENIKAGLGRASSFAVFADYYSVKTDMEGNIAVNMIDCNGDTRDIGNSTETLRQNGGATIHVRKVFTQPVTKTIYFQLYCGEQPVGTPQPLTITDDTEGAVDFTVSQSDMQPGTYHVYEMTGTGDNAKRLLEGDKNGDYIVSYEGNEFSPSGQSSADENTNYIASQALEWGSIQGHTDTNHPKGFDTIVTGTEEWRLLTQDPDVLEANFLSHEKKELSEFTFIAQTLANANALSKALAGKTSEDADASVQIYTLSAQEMETLQADQPLEIAYNGTKEQLQNGTGPLLVLNLNAAATRYGNITIQNTVSLTPSDDRNYSFPIYNGGENWAPMAGNIIWNIYSSNWLQTPGLYINGQTLGTVLCPSGILKKGTAGNLVGAAIASEVYQYGGEIHKKPLFCHGSEVTVTCTNTILGLPTGLVMDTAPIYFTCGAGVLWLLYRSRRHRRAVRHR